jgi:hypothetical protein
MERWKWILATAALMIGVTGGAFAEEQRGRNFRDNDNRVYAQRYERDRNYTRNHSRNDSYRDRDGDRDDRGYSQYRDRDNRDHDQFRRDHNERHVTAID